MLVHRVKPGHGAHLTRIDPGATGGLDRSKADQKTQMLEDTLKRLQETLYASSQNSVLIVLQGMDTAGKDGTISHVMAHTSPTGVRVESFKVPTGVEMAHDFLWRVHQVTPAKGTMGIFNRSYYEDVLVARVHKLVPRDVWERRYDHINNFESLLVDNGTRILKFFLYISQEEQAERLRAREQNPTKTWKLSTSDWPEHRLYDQYIEAYEDALTRCSTEHAPWYVVPADHKWFRNLAVVQTIVDVLQPDQARWEEELRERGTQILKAIQATRPV